MARLEKAIQGLGMCLSVVFAYKTLNFILVMPIEKRIRKGYATSTRCPLPGNSDLMQTKFNYL